MYELSEFARRCLNRLLLVALACSAAPPSAVLSSATAQETPPLQLLQQHCGNCHSGNTPKGGFLLSSLSADFTERGSRERWLNVLHQLQERSMPPASEPQPTDATRNHLITWISNSSTTAELQQRAFQGRVVMRRLQRDAWANTIRDLLHVDVDLTDLLPLETSTNGFDNNAELLHTSSFLMQNYLDATDRVLDAAIADEPQPWILKKRFDIREEKSVRPTGSVYRHTDDGVAIFATWESANIRVTMWNFRSHVRGKYRFRITGYGFQSDGKPISFRVTAGTLKEVTEERLVDYFSVPADTPTTVEFTLQLEPENRIRILAEGLPALPPAVEKIGADKYLGPGLVIQHVDVEGPLLESWPPPSHKAIFGDLPLQRVSPERFEVVSSQPQADAERILRDFARRAFRRPVTDAEIRPFLGRVQQQLQQGRSFEQAIRSGLKGILVSPQFLFLRERGPLLNDFELASRLSYFLWNSMPDEQLFQLAADNRLHEPGVLREQVERLLQDPRSSGFRDSFTGQWLSLRAIDATLPDATLYPEYDDILKTSMLKETTLFFNEVLSHDLPLTHFVSSDFTFLNARLARHYRIPGIDGMEMSKVQLPPDSHRGGLLTMGSILKVTANGTTTSPIVRGAWVLERILGTPPPKPPANISAIEPDIRGATTIREQLAKHRTEASCASCHRQIDPPGFALESFDVIGGWREHYRATGTPREIDGRRVRFWDGPAVDPADVLPDGRQFANVDEYKQRLLEDRDQLARNLIEKLLAWSTGATPTRADQPDVESILAQVRQHNYGFRSLIHEIVQSKLFQHK